MQRSIRCCRLSGMYSLSNVVTKRMTFRRNDGLEAERLRFESDETEAEAVERLRGRGWIINSYSVHSDEGGKYMLPRGQDASESDSAESEQSNGDNI
jgi:hypothetical protein